MPLSPRHPKQLLLLSLILGIIADQLFYGRGLGISMPLFVALGLLVLAGLSVSERCVPTPSNLWLGGAALVFAGFLVVRATPLLVVLNLLAVLGLLLLLVASYRRAGLAQLSGWGYLVRVLTALAEISLWPGPLLARQIGSLRVERRSLRMFLPLLRGLLLALPILSCFTGLLVAADGVFASYVLQLLSLDLPFDLGSFVAHLLVVLAVAWICAGGLLVALLATDRAAAANVDSLPAEGPTQRLDSPQRAFRPIGWVEALTVLLSVDLLFGGFMVIQGAYFFGGRNTLDRTGMTYAEYARHGFFELLTVACLTLGLLWTLALLTRRDRQGPRRAFNAGCTAMIVLVIGLLASAFQRMWLYEQAYGYTHLRIYTHSFMIWLAAVLVLFMLALLRERPRLFTFGTLVSMLLYLAALNLANPDALIVRENIARYQLSGKLDHQYLMTLSSDAVPELIAALDHLKAWERPILEHGLDRQCRALREKAEQQGWPAWNLADARALVAIERIDKGSCLPTAGAERGSGHGERAGSAGR